jgi:hypothetical protein
MPKQISATATTKAILKGFSEAHENYIKWSGGLWLWEAPEYLITSTVAKTISEINALKYITLESDVKSTLTFAGAKGRGRIHKDIRDNGRVDIVLWSVNEEEPDDSKPRAIIEIKNKFSSNEQYIKDVKRLTEFLKRKKEFSSLEFAAFAFYYSDDNGQRKTASDKINDKIQRTYDHCLEIVGESFSISKRITPIKSVENGAWAAACFLIERAT